MAYVTADVLTEYLGLDTLSDYVLLDRLIDAACAVIDRETGRTFAVSTDSTRYFSADAIDGGRLMLDGDLCAITSITNGDGATVASTQYVTAPRNSPPWYALDLKRSASVMWDGFSGEIAITGKWGYSTSAPDDIVQAALRLASWFYRQRDNASESDRALIAGTTTILPARIPADVKFALHPYKVRL